MNKNCILSKLSEIAVVTQGQSPESRYYSNSEGTPFLQGNRTFGNLYPSFDVYTNKVTKLARVGDVLMSVRAPVGALNFAPCDLCIGRGLASIRAKNNNNRFIYYALKYNIRNLIKQGKATTFDSVNKDTINNFQLIIPSEESVQNSVSNLLTKIDNKIEINNKINSELENLAKTIYDYWFVQFDFPDENGKPYKSSGGEMVWNQELKKEIPKDWEVKKLGDLMNSKRKKYDLKSNNKTDTIDLSIMPSGTFSLNLKNSSENFKTNLFELEKFELLFGSIRPYLLKAGFSPFKGAVNGSVLSFKPFEEYCFNFLLLTLTNKSMFEFAVSNSRGTRMPVVKYEDILNYKVAFDKNTVLKFSNLEFKEIISNNINQNFELSELRDFLLPLLMNGQVTVND